MAIDTLWVFLNYLMNKERVNGSMNLVDSYIARRLINIINKRLGNNNIPYPISGFTDHIEYLIPGGAKLGRKNGSYYIKTYSWVDIKCLIKVIY